MVKASVVPMWLPQEVYPWPREHAWHAFSAGGSTQTLRFDFTQGWIKSTCFPKRWSSTRLQSSNFGHICQKKFSVIRNLKDCVGFSDSLVLPQQVKTRSGGILAVVEKELGERNFGLQRIKARLKRNDVISLMLHCSDLSDLRPMNRFSHRHVYSDNCSCPIEEYSQTMALIWLSRACTRTDCGHFGQNLPQLKEPL